MNSAINELNSDFGAGGRHHRKNLKNFYCPLEEFCVRGIASVAVYSNADGKFSEDREKAIRTGAPYL